MQKIILESSNRKLPRLKEIRIQKGLQDRGKTLISWEHRLKSVLGRGINRNIEESNILQNERRSGEVDGIPEHFSQIAQTSLEEQDRHKMDRQTRHITQDVNRIRQIRLLTKICLRSRQSLNNNKRRLGYGVHVAVNESAEGAATQDHDHISKKRKLKTPDGYKCKQPLGEAATTAGQTAVGQTAAGHRWERTTSPR